MSSTKAPTVAEYLAALSPERHRVVPLDAVRKIIERTPPEEFIARYEASRGR